MNTTDTISSHCVPDGDRISLTTKLFGMHFPMHLEPFVFDMAGRLSPDYKGGYWQFYALSNGGFYMAPNSDSLFNVTSENGYEGQLSADALGITACLYAYSHLSFTEGDFAQICAQQYHWLRDYMMEHAEVRAILGAID
ncbi:MAG: antirestriction protein [Polynucleobacter sp.]|uniref:antirestriction protein n=1 Tax=Polynucleobacter sp. TaxID=2029855 RepID=UPI00271EA5A0|nr:antirestriction protein [Polynucleobacter sp.]MDO8713329.1 antirestriction protein [Polynucleobacter sp.]